MYPKTQEFIHTLWQEKVFPGVSYAFIEGDQIEKQTFGFAQVEPFKRPLTPELLFDVASLTKVICTTSVILKLIEAKKIELDQPVKIYLPEFRDQDVTIRHLLTHTSDIHGFIPNRDQLNALELKQALLALPSGEDRGQKAVYTDTGLVLLGFMIEELYQTDVQSVFEQEVLKTLGMNKSGFGPFSEEQCVATEVHAKRRVICGEVHDPKAYCLGKHCGSAGLFMTLADGIKFIEMYLAQGKSQDGHQFLQSEVIMNLLQDQTPTRKLKRSLGWDLRFAKNDQRPLLFHTGYTGAFMIIDVMKQTAFLFLSNRVHPTDYRDFYLQKRNQLVEFYLEEKAEKEG